ncbi:hypothetical protein BGZ46_001674 [Entomortierella lignicola]|nr:hypothetical protein BGZ46_001674 [Entomortierella lignicola]
MADSRHYESEQYQQQQQQFTHDHDDSHAEAFTNTNSNPASEYGQDVMKRPKKFMSTRAKVIIGSLSALLLVILATILGIHFSPASNRSRHNSVDGNKDTKGNGGRSGLRPKGGNKPGGVADGPAVVAPDGSVIPDVNHDLKRVFYGMAYVPIGAQLPNCYNTQASMDQELELLAQTTKRVRLYGTDCNVLKYTLDAITRLKLDLKVVVGLWIDTTDETFARQFKEFVSVISTFGWDDILGVSVGNEVLFDKYQPMSVLLDCIKQVKDKVVEMGHPEIPVFTSDLETSNNAGLTDHEDKAGVNLHPFFSGVPVTDAADWFWKYLHYTVKPAIGNGTDNQPVDIWITEVGWPTFPAIARTNASVPSVENLQIFIDTWLCDANSKGIPYYFFEFFDAPWKIWPGTAAEGFWGLLTIDMKLKVKLPDCLAD